MSHNGDFVKMSDHLLKAGVPYAEALRWASHPTDLLSGEIPANVVWVDPERAITAAQRYAEAYRTKFEGYGW